jgi:hypothetical protein
MKLPRHGRQRAAETGRAKAARNAPEPAAVTWTRAQLRDQIQRAGVSLAPAAAPVHRRTHEPEHAPLADREAEP